MSAKAANYLQQLDIARCEGSWSAVPELVRKVRKHAPDRSCLAITAETECAISNATHAASTSARQSGSSSGHPVAVNLDIATILPKLLESIENETQHVEDRFQAQVCAGWLHWVVADYRLALAQLPSSLDPEDINVDPAGAISEWTTVCALKAAYLRANCLSRDDQRKASLTAFLSGLNALSRLWSGQGARKQLSYWSELYLTEYCMLASQSIRDGDTLLDEVNSIACFRSWAKYWETMSAPAIGGYGFRGSVPRRRVWYEYYWALSRILAEDLPYPTGHLGKISNDMSARGQLRVEIKSAEAAYQTLLLTETTFPRADEERAEVEVFVQLVVKNWSILSGRGWREQDLGQGGRNSLTRGVLDVLYNAAQKTYHSTAILRSLFVVHLAVAEFDLAFKAFDSYLDIVKKGKVRVDKTGEAEPGLDDDGTVLETISQAIIALCRYGNDDVIEKARQLGAELEDWLARLPQFKSSDSVGSPTMVNGQPSELHPPIAPHVLALSWQAIGLSQAHWSRATHDATSRPEIQARAIRCLRRSVATELGRSRDVRSYFSLALLLAERRELTTAIEVARTALLTSKGREEQYHLLHGPYWQERSLIPMWHLLALLLSARQDYILAARACEGAFEQFRDPSVLFGKGDPHFKSEHLKDLESSESRTGLVDEMDDAEKESILEVKMTQLSLVELLEGPEVAVNASYELLTLFSRLFGNIIPQSLGNLSVSKVNEPPKTAGTFRSIRGSFFGGRDKSRPATRQASVSNTAVNNEKSTAASTRPATARTVGSAGAPTIQITENHQPPSTRRGSTGQTRGPRSESAKGGSFKKRDRSMSGHRRPSTADVSTQVVEEEPAPPSDDNSDFFSTTSSINREISSASAASSSRGRPLPTLNSFLSNVSKSSEHAESSTSVTYTSGDLLPLIQFSSDKERVQRTTILIGVWLMIAGFYRRASLYDDCEGAVTEAKKLVQSLEADKQREPSDSSTMKGVAWAEKKSIEDLWGDVFAEYGHLSVARNAPYDGRSDFETALTYSPNHPAATVGLSNILLDVYSEVIRPVPTFPRLEGTEILLKPSSPAPKTGKVALKTLPTNPLGLGTTPSSPSSAPLASPLHNQTCLAHEDDLPEPYKATCLPLAERLAARDRAHGLLSGLTRLGTSWNYSDAWFALARAHEESGQADKAKDVLWWCIELEEARPVRDWGALGGGSYVL
ncbi:unnamed protein product [Clonostachys chloroleuca]|uniref:Cargo-transport protein ypp1 n=1 Tax=Clonostachys chloroleuca TaxID=1926264 RepID=A0AA35M874_9HYPO|nr:unnamed protein product [Clonostachys chloroleuca]